MYTLNQEKKLAVIGSLVEGNSIRSTERMTGVHRDTICRLLLQVGQHCGELFEVHVRNVPARYVQADEIWTYVGKKDRHKHSDIRRNTATLGCSWRWKLKLIPAYVVGKRDRQTTYAFLLELQRHLADERFQLTTDRFHFYERGVEDVFGGTVDFAQLIKLYGNIGQHDSDAKYSPSPIVEVISKVRDGRPDPAHICTSHVERQNLTMRMQMRRFTRLTNAFSKKLESLKAACALHFAHYNFVRVHQSLRVIPAMAASITSRVWELGELLA